MKIYNTLSGKKEEFVPQGDEVKMYVCGVTPYSDAHLGHAMSYIIFDVVRRYLCYRGHKVKYVQNITDIDDKIIERANRLGISTGELAEKFTQSYYDDMAALNVELPDIRPKATETIPDMLKVIQGLVDKGFAYPSGGSVYFRVRKASDYGKLSRRRFEDAMTGESDMASEKEDPLDFVLWKASKPGEPSWESPWGPGRPGWHIECSVMSMKYFGDTFDIHGGGQDLVFPHHENEIAQSESYTGVKPVVRHWMHNGMVQLGGEKMSKSLGNLITIKEALERYSADDLRVFVLNSHYRSPLTYSEDIIEAVRGGLRRLIQAAHPGEPVYQGEPEEIPSAKEYYERFIASMDDDFNTSQAVARLFDLASVINRAANLDYLDKVGEYRAVFGDIAGVLGLKLEASEGPDPETRKRIDSLVEKRNEMRRAKQWQEADKVRDELADMGVTLEDTSEGTKAVWKRKR
ncbi:cysteine--tRNA ligase [Chloroflexota bacterium]